MDYKFYEHSSSISAAWIATRMKRVGNSENHFSRAIRIPRR